MIKVKDIHSTHDLLLVASIRRELVINALEEKQNTNVAFDRIVKHLSSLTNISQELIMSNTRKREVVDLRHFICHLLLTNYELNLREVGRFFNGKHHSTIIHGRNLFKNLFKTDEAYKNKVSYWKSHLEDKMQRTFVI